MPLLPDPDRAYDLAGPGSVGKAMGEDKAEPGTEAPEDIGIL